MKILKVLLTFVRFPIMDKIGFCRNVLGKMDKNPYYPNPDVSLADGVILVNQLEAAYLESRDGSRVAVSKMHDIEEKVDIFFRKLANYVERTADGDETILLSSGFQIADQRGPGSRAEFSVSHGSTSGSVYLCRKSVDDSKSYIWQSAKDTLPENESGWTPAGYSTKASCEIDGYEPGTKYWFRGAAITINGVTNYTNPIMIIVV
ncbi:MAG: hypothetical protein Q8909_19540 [Bacteroidota bacterium]|nr:hypothetical protein [Bacteroidota bacterium]